MSTVTTWQTRSTSSAATEQIAAKLASRLRGGEIIELISDLGGGKTTFVRGLAKGLGSDDHVASPSFTISRQYEAGKKRLYHLDFYRLDDPGIIKNELAEIITDSSAITVIEWAEVVRDSLPKDRLTVVLKPVGENTRDLEFQLPEKLLYLLEGLSE